MNFARRQLSTGIIAMQQVSQALTRMDFFHPGDNRFPYAFIIVNRSGNDGDQSGIRIEYFHDLCCTSSSSKSHAPVVYYALPVIHIRAAASILSLLHVQCRIPDSVRVRGIEWIINCNICKLVRSRSTAQHLQ
jgi:hypothetical protein